MNLKESGIIDMILPVGFLLIAWKAISSFIPGLPGLPGSPGVPGQVGESTTQCPRGNSYPKPILASCFPGYHQEGSFPNPSNCICDASADSGFSPGKTSPDSGFMENIPSLRMCEQIFAQNQSWPTECIIAGYPAPAIEPIPENVSPFIGKPWYCGTTPYAPGCL